MSDSPKQDTGGGLVSLPTIPPKDPDIKALLANLIQTEAGAISLAEALRDRDVRDVLKQHGVKIQTDRDVGYSSLPFELRDKIRKYAIAGAQPEENGVPSRCRRCPRLASYACIDSEWRQAIESTTFRRLSLRQGDNAIETDLALFESYVVGSRRKYPQYICLPAPDHWSVLATGRETETLSAEERMDQSISPILRLFNCIEKWHERDTGDGNLCVEIPTTVLSTTGGGNAFPTSSDRVATLLNGVPTTPQITQFCTTLWGSTGTRSLLVLLSRMPNLQSVSINLISIGQSEDDNDSDVQVFFDSLAQTVPRLEDLEINFGTYLHRGNLQGRVCTNALSFSQKLRKISFTMHEYSGSPTFTLLAPFSTSRFNPDAPPPLVWPDLTHFKVAKWHVTEALETQVDVDKALNEFMLTVGRAIRYMPRIRNLELELTYDYSGTGQHGNYIISLDLRNNIALNLELLQDSFGHSPLARLSVTHNSLGSDLAERIPSEEVRDLWKESLLHSANATLEFEVFSHDLKGGLGSATMQFTDWVT